MSSAILLTSGDQEGPGAGLGAELVLGSALVLGYRTRLVAAVLAAYCLATAFILHHAFTDSKQLLHLSKTSP